jgi:ribosome maturation factor RimP
MGQPAHFSFHRAAFIRAARPGPRISLLQTDFDEGTGRRMDAMARIADMITPTLDAMGFQLVRVRLLGSQRPVLQIMFERDSGGAPHDGGVTVDDCADVSRAVSAILDVEDPIAGAYRLEVSSPGLDRPLLKPADFERFKGFAAKAELGRPLDGRKRFQGRIVDVAGGAVVLRDEENGAEYRLPQTEIASAKLVLTDDLIAASAAARAGKDGVAQGAAMGGDAAAG